MQLGLEFRLTICLSPQHSSVGIVTCGATISQVQENLVPIARIGRIGRLEVGKLASMQIHHPNA